MRDEAERAQPMLAENKMGVDPIPRLLITMSLPMIAAMLVQALYNIVDGMFVSQLGEQAFTAVSLSYPAMSLTVAFGVGTGVGVNAALSRNLGAKNQQRANAIGRHALLLPLISSIVFTVLALLLVPWYFRMQTDDPVIREQGEIYLRIVAVFCQGAFYQMMCEKLLNSTGKTHLAMATQIVGAIVNVMLDPILIFGYFGVPAMGIAGASVATVIGQFTGAALGLYLCFRHNPEVNFNMRGFRFDMSVVKDIYRVGFPSIAIMLLGSVMTFMMNNILIQFTSTATAVFGVYFNLQSFVFMPIFGLNNGMVPIVSYNFGAGKRTRIRHTIRLAMTLAIGYMFLGFLAFQLFPRQLLGIFNASPDMYAIGVPAFRIISTHFIIAGISVVVSSICQALGYGHYSLIASLLRQIIVLIPLAYVLGKSFGLHAIWWTYPISEVVSMVVSLIFLRRVWRHESLSGEDAVPAGASRR